MYIVNNDLSLVQLMESLEQLVTRVIEYVKRNGPGVFVKVYSLVVHSYFFILIVNAMNRKFEISSYIYEPPRQNQAC